MHRASFWRKGRTPVHIPSQCPHVSALPSFFNACSVGRCFHRLPFFPHGSWYKLASSCVQLLCRAWRHVAKSYCSVQATPVACWADVILVRSLPGLMVHSKKKRKEKDKGWHVLIIFVAKRSLLTAKQPVKNRTFFPPQCCEEHTQSWGVLTQRKEGLICTHAHCGEHQAVTTVSPPHTCTRGHRHRKIDVSCWI